MQLICIQNHWNIQIDLLPQQYLRHRQLILKIYFWYFQLFFLQFYYFQMKIDQSQNIQLDRSIKLFLNYQLFCKFFLQFFFQYLKLDRYYQFYQEFSVALLTCDLLQQLHLQVLQDYNYLFYIFRLYLFINFVVFFQKGIFQY